MRNTSSASGLQIAFFTFALLLLVVPVTQWVLRLHPWSEPMRALIDKSMPFLAGAAILFGFPRLRHACLRYLETPVPVDARGEMLVVTGAKLLFPFALAGGYAMWQWLRGGEQGLAQYAAAWQSSEAALAKAFLWPHMLQMFVVAGLLAPLLEELVFRGMLYRAWERQWGWFPSMLLTSILFGLYHPNFWSAFFGSIILVCLYRRTGSLRAAIFLHVVTNISLWYPFLGQFVVPRDAVAPGDLGSWGLQLACLFAATIAIPAYVWMARRGRQPAEAFPPTVPADGAFPR